MTFASPALLGALALVPLAVVGYVLSQRRRSRYAVRFTNLDLLASVVTATPGWRRHLPPALYLLSLGALVLALARPETEARVPEEQASVVLVMDTSGSMSATDVDPTRLQAAQEAANTFVEEVPEEFRIGVVSFDTSSQILTRPTTDRTAVTAALDSLRASGGTAIGDAIESALEALDLAPSPPPTTPAPSPSPSDPTTTTPAPAPSAPPSDEEPTAVIVLLSDGANTTGDTQPLTAAEDARQAGVRVYTVALGTPDGTALIPGPNGDLFPVPVPPDPATLRQIAQSTDGRFFAAPSDDDLRSVYRELSSRIGYTTEKREVTAWFAGGAMTLLLAGGALALTWFSRLP